MKCIAKIMVSVIIGSIIIATPVWATSESENNIYYTADESAMESQQSDIIPRGEVNGKKYSFAYEFKHYARLVMNAALDKANLTVHLSVPNWAGEDKIYFSAYKDGMFGGAKKGEVKFEKGKDNTKVMKLATGNYSFRIRKSESSPRVKKVIGTGWIKQN